MRVLISEAEIQAAVEKLGRELTRFYQRRPVTILAVMTGSVIFLSDLIRRLNLPVQIGIILASSYRGTSTTPQTLQINLDALPNLAGRDVLLLDDIFDTGQTIDRLLQVLAPSGTASLKTAVLLWKDGRQKVACAPDFHCFRIPNEFVVGYGLDYDNDYRNLPYIAVLEESDLALRRRKAVGPT